MLQMQHAYMIVAICWFINSYNQNLSLRSSHQL